MLEEVWSKDLGSVEYCIRKCGLMIKEVWTND